MIHANNLFTLSCELGLERHFQIGFFLNGKKVPKHISEWKKNIQKNVEKYGDNEKKCEMTREVS